MNLFLRAKHWHLFIITFGLPMLLYFIMMANIITQLIPLHPGAEPNFSGFVSAFKLFPIFMLLFTGTLLGWQWSIAIGLQKMIPATVNMKVGQFKVFFFIPVVYLTVIMLGIFVLFSFNFTDVNNIGPGFVIAFLFIFPIHIFSMFCLFYCIFFVAKTLKTVELQREVSFSDFVAEFFLVWFYPVGVWIIQPRINKLIAEYQENENMIITHGTGDN